jgi:hypothetical protein
VVVDAVEAKNRSPVDDVGLIGGSVRDRSLGSVVSESASIEPVGDTDARSRSGDL